MVTVLKGDGENQPWAAIGKIQRAWGQFGAKVTLLSQVTTLSCVWGMVHFADQPREVFVPVSQLANGSWIRTVISPTADEASKQYLLTVWVSSCFTGATDPLSFSARQCAALISKDPSDSVHIQIKKYNEDVAARRLTITPVVEPPIGSGTSYELYWENYMTDPLGAKTEQPLRANVDVAFDADHKTLDNSMGLNIFGMYVTKLRLTQIGGAK